MVKPPRQTDARRGLLRPVSRPVFRTAIALALLLRCGLAMLPGYASDVEHYRDWALGAALWGLPDAYQKTTVDYPPVILYLLRPVGRAYLVLHPRLAGSEVRRASWGEYFFETPEGVIHRSWSERPGTPVLDRPAAPLPGSALFTALVKGLFALFDLLLAALLYRLVAERGLWGARRRGPGWGRLAALLYLWNPAVLFCSGYWGQADSIHCSLVVASLALLGMQRWGASGAALAAAGLAKPLAAPMVPILVLAAAERGRLRGAVRAGAGGLAAASLIFLPWLAAGRAGPVVEKVLLDLDAMAYTSVNGHTLWWLIGAWRDASAPLLGPLSAREVGLLLFLGSALVLLGRSRRWMVAGGGAPGDDTWEPRLFVLGAALTASFFFLSTHMHENHLLMAVPLLLAVAGRTRRLAWLAAGATAASLVNMAVHDLQLPGLLPGVLGAPAPPSEPLTHARLDWAQLVASYANSLLVAAVAAGCWIAAWRQGSRRAREDPC